MGGEGRKCSVGSVVVESRGGEGCNQTLIRSTKSYRDLYTRHTVSEVSVTSG